mmetsp:Transcript_76911/g.207775  ORF Transcript_76911/g.207775 Transcript_76911/m.207775 type:complete len:220 (-) Transcript_76911:868-1527(-)
MVQHQAPVVRRGAVCVPGHLGPRRSRGVFPGLLPARRLPALLQRRPHQRRRLLGGARLGGSPGQRPPPGRRQRLGQPLCGEWAGDAGVGPRGGVDLGGRRRAARGLPLGEPQQRLGPDVLPAVDAHPGLPAVVAAGDLRPCSAGGAQRHRGVRCRALVRGRGHQGRPGGRAAVVARGGRPVGGRRLLGLSGWRREWHGSGFAGIGRRGVHHRARRPRGY